MTCNDVKRMGLNMSLPLYSGEKVLAKQILRKPIIDFTDGGSRWRPSKDQGESTSVCQIGEGNRGISARFPKSCQVLIVDDESAILRVTSLMMERLGYTPLTMRSGLEAVDYIQCGGHAVGFVILDILLADTTGWRVYDAIRLVDHRMPVVFASGFSNRASMEEYLARDPFTRFLPKPFGLAELRHLLACA